MRLIFVLVAFVSALVGSVALGQQTQVSVSTPSTAVQSDFTEQFRVGLALTHPNFAIRFPSGGAFGGGFAPNLGGTMIGIPFRGGKLNGQLSIFAEHGSSRGITTTAPMLTVLDGVPGSAFSGTVQPFVVGLIPVVSSGAVRPPSRPAPLRPAALSPVQSMLLRGDIKIEKDAAGRTRLVTNDSPNSRSTSTPPKPDADASNLFRRGIEKYAGSKR